MHLSSIGLESLRDLALIIPEILELIPVKLHTCKFGLVYIHIITSFLNVCTTSVTEGEVGPVKVVQAPSNSLLTVPRRWFSCGLF